MQLTRCPAAVLFLHGPVCSLCLDVSSSSGQNVVASHSVMGVCMCHGFLVDFSYFLMHSCQATRIQALPSPPLLLSPMICVCHCCPIPKACLSQTFGVVEMFTVRVQGERQQCHGLKSKAQYKGRSPVLVKLWSVLGKSVCVISFTSGSDLLSHYVILAVGT